TTNCFFAPAMSQPPKLPPARTCTSALPTLLARAQRIAELALTSPEETPNLNPFGAAPAAGARRARALRAETVQAATRRPIRAPYSRFSDERNQRAHKGPRMGSAKHSSERSERFADPIRGPSLSPRLRRCASRPAPRGQRGAAAR